MNDHELLELAAKAARKAISYSAPVETTHRGRLSPTYTAAQRAPSEFVNVNYRTQQPAVPAAGSKPQ